MAPLVSSVSSVNSTLEKLKEPFIKDEHERPRVPYNSFSKDIPVISLHNLHAERRQHVIQEVMKASEEWGIFQVIDHGVSPHIIQKMMESVHGFFELPLEEKMKYVSKSTGKFCGYAQGSFVSNDPVADWRELLLGNCLPYSSRNEDEWPIEPADFRTNLSNYSQEMMNLAELLISAISEGLGMQPNAIQDASGEVEERVLFNYYPACSQPNLTLGLRRHTDHGSITILYQDQVGGLQATKDGENWVTVEPVSGAFVVNLGDYMNILSNKQLKSADHRAVVNSSSTRVTIVAFFNPAPDSTVRPLVGGEHQIPFQPCTFTEFYNHRLPGKEKKP